MTSGDSRADRWERRTEVPLVLLALAFLAAYAWPVVDPRLDADLRTVLWAVTWTVWAAFVVDLLVRLWLAERRRDYLRRHWWEVPIVVLPILRPLRLLRLVALVRVLNRTAAQSLSGRVATYVAGSAAMAVGLGALVVLDAEQEAAGAPIDTFGEALWWAVTTVTTVGYGDYYPVTVTGRVVAGVLMLVGVVLIGALTATVAAWLVGVVEEEQDEVDEAHDEQRQGELLEEIRALRAEVEALRRR